MLRTLTISLTILLCSVVTRDLAAKKQGAIKRVVVAKREKPAASGTESGPKKDAEGAGSEEEREKRLRALCRSKANRQPQDAEQKWREHFTLYEKTPSGEEFEIDQATRTIDTASELVLRRTSAVPEYIYLTDSEREYENKGADEDDAGTCAQLVNDGLDLDVTATRRENGAKCFIRIPFVDLQTLDYYNYYKERRLKQPHCELKVQPAVVNAPRRAIGQGESFHIATGQLEHGDVVSVELYGERIAEETVATTDCQTIDGKRLCGSQKKFTWARGMDQLQVRAVNFGAFVPYVLDRNMSPRPITSPTCRVDIAQTVFIDFPKEEAAVKNDDLEVQVKAVAGDKTRDIALKSDGRRRAIVDELHDGERVTVTVRRRVRVGKASVLVKEYSFLAVGRGLHYAVAGDYAANYSTASAFVTVFSKDKAYGFAQTFAYSFYYRSLDAGIWDHLGLGFHLSALGTSEGSVTVPTDGSTEKKNVATISLGVGGQVTFGANIVHLGAGYDMSRQSGYVLIGMSLPDLVKFVKTVGS